MSSISVLILEDDPERVLSFYRDFFKDNLIVVNNADDAKWMLGMNKFDLICLDHDLGGEIFVESDEQNTGYQVTKAIPDTFNNAASVIIHSFNHPAARKMMLFLEDCDKYTGNVNLAPFGTWNKSSLKGIAQ